MEERYMCVTTIVVTALTIILCFLLIYIPNVHSRAEQFANEHMTYSGTVSILAQLQEQEEMTSVVDESKQAKLNGHQLKIALPDNVSEDDVEIETDYVYKQTTINIEGIGKDYFDSSPLIGTGEHIVDVTYGSDGKNGSIGFKLDKVMEVSMETKDNNVYLDFVSPHDVYDYVVVIDAGHGGRVPGAIKQGVSEKDIDLQIVLKMKKLFEKSDKNIGVYYTRTTDCNPPFANRVGLANDSEADVFLSIHNNSTASGRMSSVSGTEVMYHKEDSQESKRLATLLHTNLLATLGSKDKGVVDGEDIYIIREAKCPVALVEVGFMTNKQELENLCDAKYQLACAQSMYDSIIEYLYEE